MGKAALISLGARGEPLRECLDLAVTGHCPKPGAVGKPLTPRARRPRRTRPVLVWGCASSFKDLRLPHASCHAVATKHRSYGTVFLVGDSRCGAASLRLAWEGGCSGGRGRGSAFSRFSPSKRGGAGTQPLLASPSQQTRLSSRRGNRPLGLGTSGTGRGPQQRRGAARQPNGVGPRGPAGTRRLRSGGVVVAAIKLVLRAEGRSGSGALMFLGKLLDHLRETRVSAGVTVTRAGAGAGTLPVSGILWVPRPALFFPFPVTGAASLSEA